MRGGLRASFYWESVATGATVGRGRRKDLLSMSNETEAPAERIDPAATDETNENARDGARKRRNPSEPAAVVGIGASAGGIVPLQQFFAYMSPESGLAFVVVMHLSPEHESNLAPILQHKTTMPVTQVTEPVKVQPNHVYVIPPNHQLAFEEDTLRLLAPQQAPGKRVMIDLFFRTLAMAFGQRAVSVIFSGSDSDGAIGVKHIRAQGGVVIAQEPSEAEYDSMPLMAIDTGMVDWVLPVAEMPPKLLEFVRNENSMRLPPEIEDADGADMKVTEAPGGETVSDETRAPDDESALAAVLDHLHAQTGHDFTHYKRATVLRRIARRLQVNSIETIPKYLEFLRVHSTEVRALLQDMLIGVTHFFRDRESFAALEAHIPQLFAGKAKDDNVRVWVAGCSSGEEAYSIAMLLAEHAAKLPAPPGIQVFASDIDEQAITEARGGLFPSTIEADVSQERLRRFFAKDQGRYRVRKTLREKVLFSAHNLLSNAPFSRIDLISCRNLLIYLNGRAQEQVFDTFHFSLRSGGLLFIGSAESSAVEGLFAPVDSKHRLYVRRSVPRAAVWKMPGLPMRAVEPILSSRVTARSTHALPMLGKSTMEDSGTQSDEAGFRGQERRAALFGELHLKLLEQYAPPSIVVNEEHDVVHLSDKAGRYLHFTAGEASMNLFRVINPALQIELRTALFRASQGEEANVTSAPQTVHVEGRNEVITLQVRRIASAPAERYFLVIFEVRPDVAPRPPEPSTLGEVTRGLDDEIDHLKQQLSATVEQYEASNKELKASNEELQAMNEELRSATEELETNKEELQSVNEELGTVNAELKNSVEDLSRANSDLNNLMASTDIGTVFLDRQLRIVRFTPSAQMVFNLLPADLGRPLADITHRLDYDDLIPDAMQVLDSLTTVEREVPLGGGERRWFLVRMAPYRTADDRISGVVATFIDVTMRRRAEEELRQSREELERQARVFNALSTITDFAYLFDREGRFVFANKPLLDLWDLELEEAVGKNFFDLEYEPKLAAKLQRQIEEVFTTGEVVRDETTYINPKGKEGYYEYTFSPLRGADGEVQAVVGSTHVITERKQAELALRESEERFRTVADNVPQVIWTNDAEGFANYFNRRWYDYSGLSYEESAGPAWQAIVHPDDAPAAIERWQEAQKTGDVFDAEYRLRNADGEYRWFIGRNVPLHSSAGRVLSWFGTATDIHDLKLAQAKLHETEERFRLLVEGAPDYAMFLLDVDNQITFWSAGAQQVFGWTPEEVIGQKASMIFTPEDLERGKDQKELLTALNEGSAPDRRWHIRKDGSRLWLDGFMRRLDHDNGELRGFAKIAREATEQKEAEDQLRHARDEMEQRVVDRTADLLKANSQLVNAMKERQQLEKDLLEISEREKRRIGEDLHDMVCQELTATALFLKSHATRLAHENPEAAATLDESAQTVNQNVGVARDLARGLQPAELGASGLTAALRDLAAQTSANYPVKCKLITPRTIRLTDETLGLSVYRIAQEAVTNAVKHSGATEITICIERARGELRLVIEDNGKGMKPRKKGRGLGLHIMKYRANVLGGTVAFEPGEKRGTRLICVLPLKR